MITWITRQVAIGEFLDAINAELLKEEKIDCMLNLRVDRSENVDEYLLEETLDSCAKDGFVPDYYHIEVGRHQGLEPIKIELKVATYMLIELVEKYRRILVYCTAGMDRSPFVVASWLANKEYYRLEPRDQFVEAYKDIKKKRPQVREHYEWI